MKLHALSSQSDTVGTCRLYCRVIALILVNIVPSWDIEGRELAIDRRYPIEGQYSPIYSYEYLFRFPVFLTFKTLF